MKRKCPRCGAKSKAMIAGAARVYTCGSVQYPEAHNNHFAQSDRCKINALTAKLEAAQAGNTKLEADIQEMVNKAASKHLHGYRELGDRAAHAETALEAAQAEIAELRAALHELADWQNGPPLQTQKYIDGWGAAMKEAGRLLGWPTGEMTKGSG